MKIYLVGGAVRDKLLGEQSFDKDYVVVGGSEAEMLSQGFNKVGKDFPVFLHPQTQEEYALARVEKKVAPGYDGFTTIANKDVTLAEDLKRRDLTLNAMAMDENGKLYDPFNGKADIENKVLRHVSSAFIEDPLRVLRVARFYARFHHLGFTIAPETMSLMYQMVKAGELAHLVAERVWLETDKALTEPSPQKYFEALRQCDALRIIFPELHALFGVPQTPKWHGEIDTGVHTLMVLKEAARISQDKKVRFAALLHDLGKGVTEMTHWPSHPNHADSSGDLVRTLCQRLKVPKFYTDLAYLVALYHTQIHKVGKCDAKEVVTLLQALGALKQSSKLEEILLACQADAYGRLTPPSDGLPQADLLKQCQSLCINLDMQKVIGDEKSGEVIKRKLFAARVELVDNFLRENNNG